MKFLLCHNKIRFLFVIIYVSIIYGFRFANKAINKNFKRSSVSETEWLTDDQIGAIPTIQVRFINTVDGKDVIANCSQGENLLALGDRVGVKLPRACRTGLCGSCTAEVQDPKAIATASNKRNGFATIR